MADNNDRLKGDIENKLDKAKSGSTIRNINAEKKDSGMWKVSGQLMNSTSLAVRLMRTVKSANDITITAPVIDNSIESRARDAAMAWNSQNAMEGNRPIMDASKSDLLLNLKLEHSKKKEAWNKKWANATSYEDRMNAKHEEEALTREYIEKKRKIEGQ